MLPIGDGKDQCFMATTLATDPATLGPEHRVLFEALLPNLEWVNPPPQDIEVTNADERGIAVGWYTRDEEARPNKRGQPVAIHINRALWRALSDADEAERQRLKANIRKTLQGLMAAYPGDPERPYAFVIELDQSVTDQH